MLSNEQCIEVAEKVWGWDIKLFSLSPDFITTYKNESIPDVPTGTLRRVWFDEKKRRCTTFYAPKELQKEVNSWSGFGRTVEAMANKKLSGDSLQEFSVIYEGYLAGSINSEALWRVTHLAALEEL